MKILLFPGAFSPTHFGHLRLLSAAIDSLKPDVSVISPTYKSSTHGQPDFATRCAIAREAVNNTLPLPLSEMVEVGTFHLKKDDASQFHESIMFYRDMYADLLTQAEIWILLGREGAKESAKWKFTLQMAKIAGIVASRCSFQADLDRLQSKGFAVKTVPFKPSDMSSAQVREVLLNGRKDHWRYVPRAVFRLLEERNLYGVGSGVGDGCGR